MFFVYKMNGESGLKCGGCHRLASMICEDL